VGLPLLERATVDGETFVLLPKTRRGAPSLHPSLRDAPSAETALRMPDRRPGPGEQYRFHFDMGACIGCKCCVVACNEQNGNPASINWRRVGDIQGGFFPMVAHAHLSMSCNHCLEPTCLEGCPVDAYSKDAETGIVHHSADTCIGCQYCTWNCSYGAPQFNPERGVVGKCDMCHGRLALGQAPACVSACPQGAITIEIVNTGDWRRAVAGFAADAGAPVNDHSLSTTRVTLPASLPPDIKPVDAAHIRPEHPHWPLVVMLVLTQLSAGAFVSLWLMQLLGASTRLDIAALGSLLVASLALGASTLHLGRPVHAYRALKMWRRSWLSREVLLFTLFSGAAAAYAGLLWLQWPGSVAAGAVTSALGIAGVFASACIYRVPARPSWNTRHTVAQFLLTGATLGPLFAVAIGAGDLRWLGAAAAVMAAAQLVLFAVRFLVCITSDNLALRGTARLLSSVLRYRLIVRAVTLLLGAVVLPLLVIPTLTTLQPIEPLLTPAGLALAAALLCAIGSEILGRYLFFVSVVPQHQAMPYVGFGSEAA
jgi:Fe-S-cluster-containing dehydrogenase component/DMSO reductase anchor subunit